MAEDNSIDIKLLELAFVALGINCEWTIVSDGDELLTLLNGADMFDKGSAPNLLILDLNLPKRDGWEIIAELNKSGASDFIPVVVFTGCLPRPTTSQSLARCWLEKPHTWENWVEVAREMLRVVDFGRVGAKSEERPSSQAA
jgi:two-component system, chemotaxis family, response regulator Rcp1